MTENEHKNAFLSMNFRQRSLGQLASAELFLSNAKGIKVGHKKQAQWQGDKRGNRDHWRLTTVNISSTVMTETGGRGERQPRCDSPEKAK